MFNISLISMVSKILLLLFFSSSMLYANSLNSEYSINKECIKPNSLEKTNIQDLAVYEQKEMILYNSLKWNLYKDCKEKDLYKITNIKALYDAIVNFEPEYDKAISYAFNNLSSDLLSLSEYRSEVIIWGIYKIERKRYFLEKVSKVNKTDSQEKWEIYVKSYFNVKDFSDIIDYNLHETVLLDRLYKFKKMIDFRMDSAYEDLCYGLVDIDDKNYCKDMNFEEDRHTDIK